MYSQGFLGMLKRLGAIRKERPPPFRIDHPNCRDAHPDVIMHSFLHIAHPVILRHHFYAKRRGRPHDGLKRGRLENHTNIGHSIARARYLDPLLREDNYAPFLLVTQEDTNEEFLYTRVRLFSQVSLQDLAVHIITVRPVAGVEVELNGHNRRRCHRDLRWPHDTPHLLYKIQSFSSASGVVPIMDN